MLIAGTLTRGAGELAGCHQGISQAGCPLNYPASAHRRQARALCTHIVLQRSSHHPLPDFAHRCRSPHPPHSLDRSCPHPRPLTRCCRRHRCRCWAPPLLPPRRLGPPQNLQHRLHTGLRGHSEHSASPLPTARAVAACRGGRKLPRPYPQALAPDGVPLQLTSCRPFKVFVD